MNELLLINPARRKRRAPARRRASPARRRPARRRNPVTALAANPRRRPARRSYAARRSIRRRNPAPRGMKGIMGTLMPAATAATGALALDVVWGFIPLPIALKTGPMRHLVKGAGAIGMGLLAGMVVNKRVADQFAVGALTVVMHGAMKEAVTRFAPQIALGEYPSIAVPMSEYDENGGSLGEYVEQPGMGEFVSGMGEDVGEDVYL